MASPIASQVLGEVLPYLEIQKNEEEKQTIEVPDVRNLSFKEAKQIIREAGLEIEIPEDTEIDEENTIIKDQTPKPGIKIQEENKVTLEW